MQIFDLKNITFDDIQKDISLRNSFLTLYKSIFSERVCESCTNNLKTAYYKLISLTPQKINVMINRQFYLKKGTLLHPDFMKMDISNDNLTDEIALKLLKKNRAYLKYFEKVPENWTSLLHADNKEVEKVPEITPITEVPAGNQIKEIAFDVLKSMSYKELQNYASNREETFPEYLKKKNAKQLLKYLLDNLK